MRLQEIDEYIMDLKFEENEFRQQLDEAARELNGAVICELINKINEIKNKLDKIYNTDFKVEF